MQMMICQPSVACCRDFYIHLRDWIVHTEVDAYRCGRVLEYTWHMIFGEGQELEPVSECDLLYCEEGAQHADLLQHHSS